MTMRFREPQGTVERIGIGTAFIFGKDKYLLIPLNGGLSYLDLQTWKIHSKFVSVENLNFVSEAEFRILTKDFGYTTSDWSFRNMKEAVECLKY